MTIKPDDKKAEIQALILKWTPLHAHGIRLSLSYPRASGFLKIKHTKPIVGTTKEFIEGLLIGAGLAPSYYGDYGPMGGQVPAIEWEGPDK
jgi:hypothetical protein